LSSAIEPVKPNVHRRVSKRTTALLTEFERDMGGRAALVEILAHVAETTQEGTVIASLVCDPANDRKNLGTLCVTAGIPPHALLRMIRDGHLGKAQAAAMRKVAQSLPTVVEDVMYRALPILEKCSTCHGRPPIDPLVPCWRCEGSGKVENEPTLDRQKLALELGGLINKPRGPQVQINNQQAVAMNMGALREFQTKNDKLVYGEE
jgi:hypothetical protein